MNSASFVDEQIEIIKQKGIPLSDKVWESALLTVGWPYVFGDRGEYCTPSHRQTRYNSTASGKNKDNIKDRCQNFDGTGSCVGCKWYPNGMKVRGFDCRGFTYWCLMKFGIKIMGVGCTAQWNDESNWEAKGTVDNIPDDTLVCLFYYNKDDPKVWEHTGFGYKGQTIECSNGVQHFSTRNKKWTHWAQPKGIGGSMPMPTPTPETKKPTIRKGSRGEYVTLLQTTLIQRGYSCGSAGADGIFGNDTLYAVKKFQMDNGLQMDGIVGPATWAALDNPVTIEYYTLTIPHLPKYEAEAIAGQYKDATIKKE